MDAFEALAGALSRCPSIDTVTLPEFLGDLLTENLETLAQRPGTPGQVLASQFCCYARASVALVEPLLAESGTYTTLQDALRRIPDAPKAPKRRKPRHADTSDPETPAGR